MEREFRRVLGELPAEVYIDVPETRPAEFYSLELTATATAHCWCARQPPPSPCSAGRRPRNVRASCSTLAAKLLSICYASGPIGSATLEEGYRFDDIESGTPRYQALTQITH
ncbi:MAG: hypothetical protein ACLTSX_00860 [Collinsella sp.]